LNFPNIEAERARLGYSKVEFAEKLGVETKTYYNWIKGVNPIPSDKLILLSKICNASIDYLLGIKKRAL
jgi:transcriptional regulator with XRE-family HTH domain